jgi:hypothetical protein
MNHPQWFVVIVLAELWVSGYFSPSWTMFRAERAPVDLVPLHAKIAQQALELELLNSALTKAGLLSAKP